MVSNATFPFSPEEPLATEHAAVSEWVKDAIASLSDMDYYRDVDPKDSDSGRALLASAPERSRLIVQAAVLQAQFCHGIVETLRQGATREEHSTILNKVSGWPEAISAQRHTVLLIATLLRRNLPLDRADMFQLLGWLTQTGHIYGLPLGQVTKALERYTTVHGMDAELARVTQRFAGVVRQSYDKTAKRLATTVDQLCSAYIQSEVEENEAESTDERRPPPSPSAAGNPHVLVPLKVMLGMLPANAEAEATACGPDRYTMLTHSPLASAHQLLTKLLEETVQAVKWGQDMDAFIVGQTILRLDPSARSTVLVAAMERHMASLLGPSVDYSDPGLWKSHSTLSGIVSRLGRKPVELGRELLFDLVLYLAMRPHHTYPRGAKFSDDSDVFLLNDVEFLTNDGSNITDGERFVLMLWRIARVVGPQLGTTPTDIARLTHWIGDRAKFFLVPGERWSDALNADLASLPRSERNQWIAVLRHALTATGARPSAKWLKTGRDLIAGVGEASFRRALEKWLALVSKGRSQTLAKDPRGIGDTIHDENANALRGLLWMLVLLQRQAGDARLAGGVALSAYKKTPGVGPRAVKVGNAAVYALSEMVGPAAMAQLAMLKVRVRFGSAQKEIEKAFDAAARELQLPREEIEELSVPDCGLTSVGLREETMGEYTVRVEVKGSDVVVSWFDARAKPLKAAPAAVKKNYADDHKDLQGDIKDLQAMISAQKERIDGLFLEQKIWPAAVWRERYLDHPVVGTIARRLLWCIDGLLVSVVDGRPTGRRRQCCRRC